MSETREARIDQAYPPADGRMRSALTDDDLLELYALPAGDAAHVRVNFVSSIDGAATVDGRSGTLGGPADKRVFAVLRRLCDVVVVGSGTVRAEGYGDLGIDAATEAWRVDHGLAAHPTLAIVSPTLSIEPDDPALHATPHRTIVLTCDAADVDRRAALAGVADVISCGADQVEPARVAAVLAARGLPHMLCEGGPTVFGAFIAADAVDELCLTVGPVLEGGAGGRIATAEQPTVPLPMRLEHLLVSGEMLITRYSRLRSSIHRDPPVTADARTVAADPEPKGTS